MNWNVASIKDLEWDITLTWDLTGSWASNPDQLHVKNGIDQIEVMPSASSFHEERPP